SSYSPSFINLSCPRRLHGSIVISAIAVRLRKKAERFRILCPVICEEGRPKMLVAVFFRLDGLDKKVDRWLEFFRRVEALCSVYDSLVLRPEFLDYPCHRRVIVLLCPPFRLLCLVVMRK